MMVDESQKSDQVIRTVIVPTAATGLSPLTPKIIQFDWDKETDEKGSGTTLVNFITLAAKHLAPFGKSVLEHSSKGEKNAWFKVAATLEGNDSESEAGALWFLPTGMLWLGATSIFFPFESLTDKLLLIFILDLSDTAAKRTNSYSAMKLMCQISGPFYAKKGGETDPSFVQFGDIRDFSMKDQIHGYFGERQLRIMNVEQTFYNYKERTPQSGFMPLMS